MGEASAAKARNDFDESRVVQRVMDTYSELARSKGLEWTMNVVSNEEPSYRRAVNGDTHALSELHRQMIGTSFLASLGPGLLQLLYSALIESEEAFVEVAELGGVVVAFIAGTENTSSFYRYFVRHFGVRAAVRVAPYLLRPSTVRRVWETLRYGSEENRASSELLSMAVAPSARRRGVGRRLVEGLLSWASERGIERMIVVVGEDNEAATSLYNEAGFVDGRRVEVHRGASSWEFLWSG